MSIRLQNRPRYSRERAYERSGKKNVFRYNFTIWIPFFQPRLFDWWITDVIDLTTQAPPRSPRSKPWSTLRRRRRDRAAWLFLRKNEQPNSSTQKEAMRKNALLRIAGSKGVREGRTWFECCLIWMHSWSVENSNVSWILEDRKSCSMKKYVKWRMLKDLGPELQIFHFFKTCSEGEHCRERPDRCAGGR